MFSNFRLFSRLWGGSALVLLVFAACEAPDSALQKDSAPSENSVLAVCQSPSQIHDGVYGLTFESHGQETALGRFEVKTGQFQGNVINIFQEKILVEGCVQPTGELNFLSLQGAAGLSAHGKITPSGLVIGAFEIAGRQGGFSGSLEHKAPQANVVKLFDGNYQVSFEREGVTRAQTLLKIQEGVFSTEIVTQDSQKIEAWGYVLGDGTLVLTTRTPETAEILLAQARIDSETQKIQGLYRLGERVGQINGEVLAP